jgi:hypothetical protein
VKRSQALFKEERDELICALRLADGSDLKGKYYYQF